MGKCCEKVFQSILGKNKAQKGCFIIGLHLFAFGIFIHNDSKNLLKFNLNLALMQKMTHAREIKRDAVFIGCLYHFIIAYAATGLGYGTHTHLARLIYAVAERKKRLAR